jgi:hypothetical protein
MATPTSLPATFVAGNVLTAAQMNDLRGAFRILQVVRATDSTNRSTTSGSLVDASISVTITPTSASNDVLLIWSSRVAAAGGNPEVGQLAITDSSNVGISGAESCHFGNGSTDDTYNTMVLVGFDSPATTSATTYKGRFGAFAPATVTIQNSNNTGQLIAMEISA